MPEIKTEHKEFIKRLAFEGLSAENIKKELIKVYKYDVPCSRSIGEWKARFLAVSRGKAYEPNSSNGRSLIKEKYRMFIENGVKKGKTRSEVTRELWGKYGKSSVSISGISRWFHRFKDVFQALKHKNHHNNQASLDSKSKSTCQPHPESSSKHNDQKDSNCELEAKENEVKNDSSRWYKFMWTNSAAIDLRKIY